MVGMCGVGGPSRANADRRDDAPEWSRRADLGSYRREPISHVVATVSNVFMFPGQSSADAQMIRRALARHEAASCVLERARAVLDSKGLEPFTRAAGTRLESNRDVQVGVFLATQMHLATIAAEGLRAQRSLGLSLGEYSHLVHIGALTFEAALTIVSERGALYDQAPPGVMVTVLGPSRDDILRAVGQAPAGAHLSNINTPIQHVIAGDRLAVDSAARWLEDECDAHTVEIESRVPMHTPLLGDVAVRFRQTLTAAPWQQPSLAYLPNVSGIARAHASAAELVQDLTDHVTRPVHWQASIEAIASVEPDALFLEVGPGTVLHNMLGRRWLKVRRGATDAPDQAGVDGSLQAAAEALHA